MGGPQGGLRWPSRDHINPKSAGGRKTLICCIECNGRKGNMHIGYFLRNVLHVDRKAWFRGRRKNKWRL